jgi:hypothetical protein
MCDNIYFAGGGHGDFLGVKGVFLLGWQCVHVCYAMLGTVYSPIYTKLCVILQMLFHHCIWRFPFQYETQTLVFWQYYADRPP